MKSWWALAVVATIGCGGARPWAKHRCDFSGNAAATTFVYLTETHLVRRFPGGEQRLAFADSACLTHAADTDLIALSEDGLTAIVLGEHMTGGTWLHHVEKEVSVACVVDFRTGLATPGASAAIADHITHMGLDFAGTSSHVFVFDVGAPVKVLDVSTGRAAALPFHASLSDCDVATGADATTVACSRFEQFTTEDADGIVHPDHTDYFIDVWRIDIRQWPPAVIGDKQTLALEGPVDSIVVAADASALVFWSDGFNGHHFGVVELNPLRAVFQRFHTSAITAATIGPAGRGILYAEAVGADEFRIVHSTREDRPLGTRPASARPSRLFWAPPRVIYDSGCAAYEARL